MDTNGLLDNRNLGLWNSLIMIHDIGIRKANRPDYLALSESGRTTIFVPHDNINPAYFTHELLHIYLRTKGVFIGGALALSIKESKILSRILSDNLIHHIGNCLDHIKMLPKFLDLGFNESDFLSDYSVNKLTDDDLLKIKRHYMAPITSEKVYNASAVDHFIGKYFAASSCPNRSYDYARQLKKLEIIDPDLFEILETFLIDWKNLDYNDTDPTPGSYNLLLFNFIENLKAWTNEKTIK